MTKVIVRHERHGTQEAKQKRATPMPRAKRREQLLGVARGIIQRGGIGALTMSALAEEAGVSKPVVYEHFENSESVAVALLESYFETVIDRVEARTSQAETLDEYLSIAIDTQFEFHQQDKLVVRSITNGHSSGERVNAAYRKLKESSAETLQELVRQQGASPEVAAVAGPVFSEMITNTVYEFAMTSDSERAKDTLKRMVIGAVHAITSGSRARPVTPKKILDASHAYKKSRGE